MLVMLLLVVGMFGYPMDKLSSRASDLDSAVMLDDIVLSRE